MNAKSIQAKPYIPRSEDGHIKRNLGVQAFLLRRLAGVRTEAALLATCFNIARMMTLVGVGALLPKLRTG